MSLEAGTAVGPYGILASIGAGGMGEVYRARDPRLGRDVAVKVLPSAASGEPERLRRFEQEARAAGALNHPNVLAVHDVGTHEGVPYIVSELLEGETLRRRIGGTPLPMRKVLDYAVQVARGLAAAHEKGIVHRDLKPDNLFVTKDGRVKILDFGLAKLGPDAPVSLPPDSSLLSAVDTATGTLPGALLGTLGYMSPEQVQGRLADARSDIFAFGTVLYEMLTGRRAFKAATAPETLTAILKQDPLETLERDVALSPGLERVLRHCLEKSPGERFQSAQDLAFALEALSGLSDTTSTRMPALAGRRRRLVAVGAALTAGTALGLLAGGWLWTTTPLRFKPVTFRAGTVSSARFSPDGQTIAYSAAWDGGPLETYIKRVTDVEARPLGLPRARVLSVSPTGELAVQLLAPDSLTSFFYYPEGTLARIPLAGGSPREMLEHTLAADWSPDGGELAVSHFADGKYRLEYPPGRVLHESEHPIGALRISPRGDLVAFLEQVSLTGQLSATTRLSVVDRGGRQKKILHEGWGVNSLAWSASGREIWIDTFEETGARGIRAVSLGGKSRLLIQLGGTESTLADLSRDGTVLAIQGHGRHVIHALAPDEDRERNLSWRHDSTVVDMSRDGRTLLFSEVLSGGGRSFGTGTRKTDGSPAVHLGEGFGYALSPDGRWALALTRGPSLEFVLLPLGAGERKRIAEGLPAQFHGAAWLPDSRRFIFSGSAQGEGARLYQQAIDGPPPRPLTDPGADLRTPVVSPDGSRVAAIDADGQVVFASLPSGEVRPVPGVGEEEIPIQWRTDGRALFVYRPYHLPVEIFEVDVASGQRRRQREIVLPDPTGVESVVVTLTPDGRSYAYSFRRSLDELYLVEGLH